MLVYKGRAKCNINFSKLAPIDFLKLLLACIF